MIKKILLGITILLFSVSTSMSADRLVKNYYKTENTKTVEMKLKKDLPYVIQGQKDLEKKKNGISYRNTKPQTVWFDLDENSLVISFDDFKDGVCDRAFFITLVDVKLMMDDRFQDAVSLDWYSITCDDLDASIKEALKK